MAGLNGARRAIAAAIVIGSASLALAGCENALTRYLLKGIFYQGWKVASWSTPAPVVANQTHLLGESNGLPLNLAMGSNGWLHLVGWKSSDTDWVYTSMAPGAAEFEQTFTFVNSTTQPDDFIRSPSIDLWADDTPFIAYGVGYSGSNHELFYQEYFPGTGTWSSPPPIVSNNSSIKYAPVFLAFFSVDLESHVWYLAGDTIFHTIASPPSPAPWLSGIGKFAAARLAANDVAFVYTDTAKTQLLYRSWSESSSTPLWTAPSGHEIGEMTITTDSDGAVYACCGSYNPADEYNTAYYALHFFTNAGGAWHEMNSITGNASSGPMYMYPCAIRVAPDRYGNDHLHMAYTIWTLPSFISVWYTYYEESGWHPPQELDTLHTGLGPQIAVDPAGKVHIVYTWWAAEGQTTMMYVRGTPGEPQNQ